MRSLWVTHPTGNVFVRALLAKLKAEQWDYHFYTSFGFAAGQRWLELLPKSARAEISRRAYEIPAGRLSARPIREGLRVATERFGRGTRKRRAALSVDAVYRELDGWVAKALRHCSNRPEAVYNYEDGALETFEAAAELGVQRVYDLPIVYWEHAQRILAEEAERLPDWEPTLGATRDSEEKLERKSRELALAEAVICPSNAVLQSLPQEVRARKRCVVVPFGSPAAVLHPLRTSGKLRVLFAGQMSQRKGLADVFAAKRLLQSREAELVVMGSPLMPLSFYRARCEDFVYEQPRPHKAVLELMASCDVLVLPSLVEGRALVQQEALACGLPIIVTANAGGDDLVEEGRTGFLVPIRSPESIAEKIDWFAANRPQLEAMRENCWRKAAEYTWDDYGAKILGVVSQGMRSKVQS